jgi:hypothetical protein
MQATPGFHHLIPNMLTPESLFVFHPAKPLHVRNHSH